MSKIDLIEKLRTLWNLNTPPANSHNNVHKCRLPSLIFYEISQIQKG